MKLTKKIDPSEPITVDTRWDIKGKPPIDVFNPNHYKDHPSGVQCIQITEHMGFCLGNAIKYIWRAGLKDKGKKVEDLKKAIWYIQREIDKSALDNSK